MRVNSEQNKQCSASFAEEKLKLRSLEVLQKLGNTVVTEVPGDVQRSEAAHRERRVSLGDQQYLHHVLVTCSHKTSLQPDNVPHNLITTPLVQTLKCGTKFFVSCITLPPY